MAGVSASGHHRPLLPVAGQATSAACTLSHLPRRQLGVSQTVGQGLARWAAQGEDSVTYHVRQLDVGQTVD